MRTEAIIGRTGPIECDAMLRVLHRRAATRQCDARILRLQLPPTIRHSVLQRRAFLNLPNVLVPPVVFGGLFIGLWTWKCIMMITFQNKIIYMPGLPPNTRSDKIADYESRCQGIQWREERTKSVDGTQISLCVASVNNGANRSPHGRGVGEADGTDRTTSVKDVYILYFQGNASSLPPRLPFLSPILRLLKERPSKGTNIRYTMVCCSYRGYWTSKGRPTEIGIAMDAVASLQWIRAQHDTEENSGHDTGRIPIVIWGQSIGSGVATTLASRQDVFSASRLSLTSLILETPFLSIRAMLETLYPQKWLPYKYLWPFLRNHLDSGKALGSMKENCEAEGVQTPIVLILEAERDELVPKEHTEFLERRCHELGLEVEKRTIGSSLHVEVLMRPGGISTVVEAVEKVAMEA